MDFDAMDEAAAKYETSRPRSDRKPEVKQRNCLMCRRPFESSWPGERVCRRCKATGDWRGGGGVG